MLVLLISAILTYASALPAHEGLFAGTAEAGEYIVNGEDVAKGRWPWMLSLEVLDPEFRHTCGATLLDEQHAMTAAHCLDGRYPDMPFRVVIGASNRGDNVTESDREDTVNIAAAYLHEDYNCRPCAGAFPNDVAIMYLERPTTLNEFVQPAILASAQNDEAYEDALCYSSGWGKLASAENDEAYEDALCYSSGWGKLAGTEDDVPIQLQEIEIQVLNTTECRDLMPVTNQQSVQDQHVCIWDPREVTDEEKRGICQGDSGGPVQCELNGEWHVLGAASWVIGGVGTTCNPAYPGAYNRATYFTEWIEAVLADDSWKP